MKASLKRETKETCIEASLDIYGKGLFEASTGIELLDDVLRAMAAGGGFDLSIKASGDYQTGDHHTVEDVGISLGSALKKALGEKKGIERFADARIPMDEALATAAVDISGRSCLAFDAKLGSQGIGGFNPQNTRHFFESLVSNAGINAHLAVTGENDHHKIEALFKAFAVALKRAVKVSGTGVPSTKGVL